MDRKRRKEHTKKYYHKRKNLFDCLINQVDKLEMFAFVNKFRKQASNFQIWDYEELFKFGNYEILIKYLK